MDKVVGAFTIGGGAFLAMAFASTAATYVSGSVALNPAIAVTLSAVDFTEAWTLVVYFIAPILGAVIGFFLFDLVQSTQAEEKVLRA